MAVEFFSSIDKKRNPDTGEQFIASEHPSWYMRGAMHELEEDIRKTSRRLETGRVPERRKAEVRADLARMEKKLETLKASMPKRDPKTTDECAKLEKETAGILKDVLDRREAKKRGTSSPQRLAERMHTPCIEVTPLVAETAAKNGMRVEGNKISQNDLQRIWKYARRFNDQDSRVELLRRD